MRGTVSFHPVDMRLFDELILPLLAGSKVNPERYLASCLRQHAAAWACDRYRRALELQLELLEPPPPPTEGKLWDKVRARLERLDYRPDPLAVLISSKIEPELHLDGRPFLITEGSADRVATLVDEYCAAAGPEAVESLVLEQLVRLDPKLAQGLPLDSGGSCPSDLSTRREVLNDLKALFEIVQAADSGDTWGPAGGRREPAQQILERELPWRVVVVASRATPFWIAHDIDGLETVCHAAGVAPPAFLMSATRLLGDIPARFTGLQEVLQPELDRQQDVGAFVGPENVPELLEFLNKEGSRIIKAATQAGEGPACTTLLRKIRECARYAQGHGMGYLEAVGVPPMAIHEP